MSASLLNSEAVEEIIPNQTHRALAVGTPASFSGTDPQTFFDSTFEWTGNEAIILDWYAMVDAVTDATPGQWELVGTFTNEDNLDTFTAFSLVYNLTASSQGVLLCQGKQTLIPSTTGEAELNGFITKLSRAITANDVNINQTPGALLDITPNTPVSYTVVGNFDNAGNNGIDLGHSLSILSTPIEHVDYLSSF